MGFSFFSDLISPTKYDVPKWEDIDAGKEQQKAITDNIASFESAKGLATSYNEFMQGEVSKALKKAIPEYDSMTNQMAKNISAKLTGSLPEGVKKNLEAAVGRTSNAQARRLGITGSPAGFNLGARDIGKTYYEIANEAERSYAPFVSTVASLNKAPMFDFSTVFMSAGERANIAMRNQENKWNAQNLQNQMDAQPAPWMKAMAGLGDFGLNLGAAWGISNYFPTKSPFGSGNKYSVGDWQQQNNMFNESRSGFWG